MALLDFLMRSQLELGKLHLPEVGLPIDSSPIPR